MDWNIFDIVKILLMDEVLLQSRRKFARSLYIPAHSLQEFEDDYIRNIDLHSYFCNVLAKWKSMNGNEATISSLINILRKNDFAASADRLSPFHNCISAHVPAVTVFGVKKTVFNFVGRQNELKELNELFKANKSSVVLSSAMGGKGKTELCRRFIQQLPISVDTLITWFSGDGYQNFIESLFEISDEMDIRITDLKGKLLPVYKIVEKFGIRKKSKWVVIIDNVDDVFQDFFTAVDAFLRNGAFVVVTSRKADIHNVGKQIFLEDLENKDAWKFVRSSLDETESQELVEKLCKCLQNYPLVLQQAVAFIKYQKSVKDNSYGIKDYLLELNFDTKKVFDHKIPMIGYEYTVLKVFEMTLSKIMNINKKSKEKQSTIFQRLVQLVQYFFKNTNQEIELMQSTTFFLLQILSLVQPDGIESEFLKELFSFFEMKELFASRIETLKSFSLVGINKGEVSVHRIVQQLTRDKMKTENVLHFFINKILEKINVLDLRKKEIIQVIQIWKNALPEFQIIKENSNFAEKIIQKLYDLSLYREMKAIAEITLHYFVKYFEPDNIINLKIQYMLAKALMYNGEYEDALVKFQDLWKKEEEILGENHEETLSSAGQTASVFRLLKRLDESLNLHESVLQSKVKVYGENNLNTIIEKNNLALVLDDQGKREQALSIYKQILDWKKSELGYKHPQTLATRQNIATCLFEQRKLVDSKKQFEEILELRMKVIGDDHADTLITKYCLSLTHHALGEEETALAIMKQVLSLQKKVLGSNHPITNITRDKISVWKNLND